MGRPRWRAGVCGWVGVCGCVSGGWLARTFVGGGVSLLSFSGVPPPVQVGSSMHAVCNTLAVWGRGCVGEGGLLCCVRAGWINVLKSSTFPSISTGLMMMHVWMITGLFSSCNLPYAVQQGGALRHHHHAQTAWRQKRCPCRVGQQDSKVRRGGHACVDALQWAGAC